MATISDEVKAVFSANTDGLVRGVARAKKEVNELKKVYSERMNLVRGSIMDPSTLATRGVDKFAGSMKFSAASMGVVTAGGALLVKTFVAANDLAAKNADQLAGMSGRLQEASRVNLFAASIDGADSLREKLASTTALIKEAKQTQKDVDPYGQSGGLIGSARTVAGNAIGATQSALGLGPYSNFDREKDEAGILEYRKRIAEQEAVKLRKEFGQEQQEQFSLTLQRTRGSEGNVRVAELERAQQRELNGLRGTDLNSEANQRAITQRYGLQIASEQEGQHFAARRSQNEMANARTGGSSLSDEQKRAEIAQVNLAGVREELRERKYLTVEARRTLEVEELRAQGETRMASLALRRHNDEIAANRLDITSQREIVDLGRQNLQARQQRAELDVRAAQASVQQARGEKEYAAANNRLRQGVAEKVKLDKEAGALVNRQYGDSVQAGKLDIANRRELVMLGQRGFEARKSMADLDVQAAQAAVEQANSAQEYARANERLKQAVAARVDLEKISVATQRAAADIAYGLANRIADVNSTNASSLAKRAQSNNFNTAAMRAEMALPGTTEERRRELSLGLRGGANERREMLQERGFGKSAYQIQTQLRKERNETRLRDQFDRRMAATDGLTNVSRDINGRITSGIDILTGERRAPMNRSSGVADALKESVKKNPGINDQSAGRTALDAARATVQAINITNAYMKTAVELLGGLKFA